MPLSLMLMTRYRVQSLQANHIHQVVHLMQGGARMWLEEA